MGTSTVVKTHATHHRYHLHRFAMQSIFLTPINGSVNVWCSTVVWLNKDVAEHQEAVLLICFYNLCSPSEGSHFWFLGKKHKSKIWKRAPEACCRCYPHMQSHLHFLGGIFLEGLDAERLRLTSGAARRHELLLAAGCPGLCKTGFFWEAAHHRRCPTCHLASVSLCFIVELSPRHFCALV